MLCIVRRCLSFTFLALSYLHGASCCADDSTVALKLARDALERYGPNARVILERHQTSWRVTSVDLSGCQRDVNIGDLADPVDLESLRLNAGSESRDSQFAVHQCDRLAKLAKLRMLAINPRDLAGADLSALPDLEYLDLSNKAALTEDDVSKLKQLRHLRRLDLGYVGLSGPAGSKLSDGLLGKLAPIDGLRSLSLEGDDGLTDAGLAKVSSFRHLEELTVPVGEHITGSFLPALRNLNQLRSIGYLRIGSSEIETLAKMRSLESLDCELATGATAADFSPLTRVRFLSILGGSPAKISLPGLLRALRVSYKTTPGLDLRLAPNVRSVTIICDSHPRDAQPEYLQFLATSAGIRRLMLIQASDVDVNAIPHLDSIRRFDVEGSCILPFGDGAISAIRWMQGLEVPSSTTQAPAMDRGLASLVVFPSLCRLEATVGTGVTSNGFAAVGNASHLRALRLYFTEGRVPSARELERIGALPELEELRIQGQLSDEGLAALAPLRVLRRLDLRSDTGYSDAALGSLMDRVPQLVTVIRTF